MLLKNYEPFPVAAPSRVSFELRAGAYVVKLAEGREELESAIRLRSEVFRDDFGATVATSDPLWDFGELDHRAQHLIVKDVNSGKTVGTYRLILSRGSDGFYSQSEFYLSEFLERPGLKLELSRACVDPAFRNGTAVILLWKGLTEYIRRTGASVLFGLSSVLSEDPSQIKLILDCLSLEGCIEDRFNITAKPEYQMSLDHCDMASAKVPELPPLLRLYLKAGARIAYDPAHDRDFKCVDLLTILEVDQMNPLVAKKYGFR